MNKMYWVRLGMMILALIAVVAVIRFLNRNPVQSAGGKSFAPLPAAKGTYNLCPTRVAWMQFPQAGGPRYEQTQTRWFRMQAGQRVEVDTIAVEKWLSTFCSALTREATSEASTAGNAAPVLQIGYISGLTQSLDRMTMSGEFELQGHRFTSRELDDALRTLPGLPPSRSPGH